MKDNADFTDFLAHSVQKNIRRLLWGICLYT